ncbi:methylthioribulose 1-phosphate dehydratase [Rheinheimera sp.]|uniref:methylthioribulose 1-phosphate dehydratase n=1 Tax=Rheinheimera sp. TaxID=1869214 RepID=UPI00307FBE2C
MNSLAQVHQLNPYAIQLCATGRWVAQRQWVPATGGNFSIRSSAQSCLVTASGKDKGELSPADLLQVNFDEAGFSCQGNPSAETALHCALYQLYPDAKAVLHTHSVQATVFSRVVLQPHYCFDGYEMQKAIQGTMSHQQALLLPVLENSQDIPALAAEVTRLATSQSLPYAFLVRGHGLYVWGDSLDQSKRHLEAWEFLIACELERIKIGGLV